MKKASIKRTVLVVLSCFIIFSGCDIIMDTIRGTETYSIIINAGTNGVVSIVPQKTTYDYNDIVTITAIADPGFQFSNWSGSATGRDNPLVFTVTANTTIIATFEPVTFEEVSDLTGTSGD